MKKKVLIIDDSAPIRFLLEAMFSKEYAVVSAEDGLAAMSWLSKGNVPDLILTDLHMPNIDGWELLGFLANSQLYREIPVVVVSGANNASSINDLKYENIETVVVKPFDPIVLLEKVKMIMNGRLTLTYS